MTQIFFGSGENIATLCKTVSKELDKLNIWFAVNKLSLNVHEENKLYTIW